MQDWKQFSEDLAEWQANPVTETVRKAMAEMLAGQRRSLFEAWLSGTVPPDRAELERVALHRCETWVEDFFESSAEDVRTVLEKERDAEETEYERTDTL